MRVLAWIILSLMQHSQGEVNFLAQALRHIRHITIKDYAHRANYTHIRIYNFMPASFITLI